MSLAEHYLTLKDTHIGLVMLSGSVFLARGLGVLMGSQWPLHRAIKITSMVIDSALLGAALLLLHILQLNPFTTPWLQAKLTLLLAYIFFGVLTFRFTHSTPRKITAFSAALLCYALMFSIARTHHLLAMLAGG